MTTTTGGTWKATAVVVMAVALAAVAPRLRGEAASDARPDVWTIGDFEQRAWSGTSRSQKHVHEGEWSGRWKPAKTATITAPGFPADLSSCDRLEFWLYSERANGQRLTLVCDSNNLANPSGWDYFYYHFTVNWKGWKHFDLCLGTDIRPTRKPVGWQAISYLAFHASGWQHRPLPDTVLYLDGVRLVRDPLHLEARWDSCSAEAEGKPTTTWTITVTNRGASTRLVSLSVPAAVGPFAVRGAPAVPLRLAAGASRAFVLTLVGRPSSGEPPLQRFEGLISVRDASLPTPPPAVRITAALPLPRREHPFLFADKRTFARTRERAASTDWGRAVFEQTIRAADAVLAKPLKVPKEPGQWSHHYVCKVCGASLRQQGNKHVCSKCGREYSGWPYDQVVAGWEHGRNLRAVGTLGLAYALTGEEKYARRARENLLAYAAVYSSFPLHNTRGRKSRSAGRLFAQTLDEAVAVIPVAWGYDLIYNSPTLTAADRQAIENRFFREVVRTIRRHDAGISNWQSWHNAGEAAVGFCLQDENLAAHALYGPSGLKFQLANSILPDGFWYEGTAAYHYYALSALRWTVEAARQAGIDFWKNPAYLAMFKAPLEYVFPNMRFPAVNDSDVFSIKGRHPLYELAFARTGDAAYAEVARYGKRRSREALLWGADALPPAGTHVLGSRIFSGLGAAVLRAGAGAQRTYIHFDYGPHGGDHGHFDKLAVILYALQRQIAPDPGRLAYGAPLQGSWYRQTVAHNTVCVDAGSQRPATGRLLHFSSSDGVSAVQADCASAYPGVVLRRTLVLVEDVLIDVFEVESDTGHVYDWVYHLDGRLEPLPGMAPLPGPLGKSAGYQHLRNLREARVDGLWTATATVPTGRVRLTLAGVPGSRVIMGEGLTGKPPRPCPVILVRRRAARTIYAAVLQIAGPEGALPPVRMRLLGGLSKGTRAIKVAAGNRRRIVAWNPGGAVGRVGTRTAAAAFACWCEAEK